MRTLLLFVAICCTIVHGQPLCTDLVNAVTLIRVNNPGGGMGDAPGADTQQAIEDYLTAPCLGACIHKTPITSINLNDKTASCRPTSQQPDEDADPTQMVIGGLLNDGRNDPRSCQWRHGSSVHPGFRATCLPRYTENNRYQLNNPLQAMDRYYNNI